MDESRLFNNISEIGRLLLKHGAEIYRVEESMERMVKAYGYQQVEVFAIPSYFNLSVVLNDHSTYTITKRSRQNRINLDSVYALNNLVRKICLHCLSNQEIEEEIKNIVQTPLKMFLVFIGYGMTAGFFSVFFGGGFYEFVISTIIGFIVYFVIWIMEILEVNSIVTTLLASMVLAFVAILSKEMSVIYNLQATIIGCLMILVPGVAITNSLRDIIGGEYMSGLARMIEAILIAASIAIGVGSVMMLLGGNYGI